MTEQIHTALITGYTGESGKALLKELIHHRNFQRIILVGRRKVDFNETIYQEKTVGRQRRSKYTLKTIDQSFRNNDRSILKKLMITPRHFGVLMFISVVWEQHEAKLVL